MTDGPLFDSLPQGAIRDAFSSLHSDLTAIGGPRISTMRNHRFAIVVYPPEREFDLRRALGTLCSELERERWNTLELSLQKLVLGRIGTMSGELRAMVGTLERDFAGEMGDPAGALDYVKEQIEPFIEGVDGLAKDIADAIDAFAKAHPGEQDRSVVFLSRVWALYPFLRASALLKHIAGRTQQLSVVLLYPGTHTSAGLRFLGVLAADRDYRPRIYP